jgi:hypothetical protein
MKCENKIPSDGGSWMESQGPSRSGGAQHPPGMDAVRGSLAYDESMNHAPLADRLANENSYRAQVAGDK